jgi:hypothetical protein
MIVYGDLGHKWNEGTSHYFKVLTQHFSADTEKKHVKPNQSGYPCFVLRLYPIQQWYRLLNHEIYG